MNTKINERAPGLHIVGEKYYLTNNPVICEKKIIKKFHYVFNASAKSNDNFSLNDCMFLSCHVRVSE